MSIELMPAELDLLMLSAVLTDDKIAERTGLRNQTIKNRRGDVYRKLGVSGQHALSQAFIQIGWLRLPQDYREGS